MSRARDIADFNASLFADDEISGDKVSGGEIGAGTFNGTLGSNATFPSNVPTEIKSLTHTTSSGNTTGSSFGDILQVLNLLDGESLLITISGGRCLQGSGTYSRSTACGMYIYDGSNSTPIQFSATFPMGGYAFGGSTEANTPGIAQAVFSNTSGSTYSAVNIKSYTKTISGAYAVWSADSDYPITITSIRYKA